MSDTPPSGDQNQNEDPAGLRKKLEDALKREKEKDVEIRQLSANNAIHQAKLGHLNEFQRSALLGALGEQELSEANMKDMAEKLGFQQQPTTPPVTPPSTPQADPNQPGFIPPNPIDAQIEGINESISGLTQQEYAHIMAIRGGGTGNDFKEALAKASSKKEALSVISNQGKHEGIILESDLD